MIKLSDTSKMPCKSWSLTALDTCPGSRDAQGEVVEVCQGCYATTGNYNFPNVKLVRENNRHDWKRVGWVNNMVEAIVVGKYFRGFDSGDIYHENLDKMTNRDRMIRLGEIERASKNTPIQGSGADMIKYALALIIEYINKYKFHDKVKIVSQVHDEISCEVRNDFTDDWVIIQEIFMLQAGKHICKDVDMVVDYTITQEWSK